MCLPSCMLQLPMGLKSLGRVSPVLKCEGWQHSKCGRSPQQFKSRSFGHPELFLHLLFILSCGSSRVLPYGSLCVFNSFVNHVSFRGDRKQNRSLLCFTTLHGGVTLTDATTQQSKPSTCARTMHSAVVGTCGNCNRTPNMRGTLVVRLFIEAVPRIAPRICMALSSGHDFGRRTRTVAGRRCTVRYTHHIAAEAHGSIM